MKTRKIVIKFEEVSEIGVGVTIKLKQVHPNEVIALIADLVAVLASKSDKEVEAVLAEVLINNMGA
jgi:hypothetical protein